MEFSGIKYYLSGSGEPLVFLHGFALDHSMWNDQVEALSKSFKVLNYDMRGFGASEIPTKPYSHHHDLKDLLKHLQLGPVHLVGLSLGGETALDFAVEYPSLLKSLTVLGSSLSGYKSTVDWGINPSLNLEQVRQNWLNHDVFKYTSSIRLARSRLHAIVNRYSGWHWFNKDPKQKAEPPAMHRLKDLNIHLTTVVGKHDLDYFKNISTYIKNTAPGAKQIIISDGGHMLNLEQPQIINKLILDVAK